MIAIRVLSLAALAVFAGDAETLARVRAMAKRYAEKIGDVAVIMPLEALQEKAVLVDVRPESETSVSIIPGAILASAFEARPEEFRDSLIVPYCTIGYRSGIYARGLQKKGFRVRNLFGGILFWAHTLGSLEHEGKATKRIHVYGRRWDLAPEGFEAVR